MSKKNINDLLAKYNDKLFEQEFFDKINAKLWVRENLGYFFEIKQEINDQSEVILSKIKIAYPTFVCSVLFKIKHSESEFHVEILSKEKHRKRHISDKLIKESIISYILTIFES